MKKFSKIMLCAATCAALGALALTGCDTSTAMTEADAATLNAAFVEAETYDGSFTIDEEYSSYVYYLSTTQYARGNAKVTYDGESGSMGYSLSAESDDENYSMGYYTVPQSDGSIMQYVDFLGYKIGVSYAAGEEVDLYYSSYAQCMEELFGLDLAEGSSITTVEGFAAYWQDFLGDSLNSLGDYYGITLSFTDVETKVESTENGCIFTFASEAELTEGGVFLGAEISAYTAGYTLTVRVEDNFITEINSAINQDITVTAGGSTVNMRGVANSTDAFSKTYDADVIPSDLSEYVTEDYGDII